MRADYLVIGGTEKAGTTSVYLYLNAHPKIAGSARKETDYFRGPPPLSLRDYELQFPRAMPGQIRMEASPGYLAESVVVAPAMAAVVPWAMLLFILRDPIDRLLSGFDFHKSRFHIPARMSFDEYFELCMRFEHGEIEQSETGLKLWHLRVPNAGRYALHLRDYFSLFPREHIKLMTWDSLQRDPVTFMRDVCSWAGLDCRFYDGFEFVRANVTFIPRMAWLQKAGLRVNNALEPFFNQHPVIKQRLLGWYKRINGQSAGKPAIKAETAQRLIGYYQDDIAELLGVGGSDVADAATWLKKRDVR